MLDSGTNKHMIGSLLLLHNCNPTGSQVQIVDGTIVLIIRHMSTYINDSLVLENKVYVLACISNLLYVSSLIAMNNYVVIIDKKEGEEFSIAMA